MSRKPKPYGSLGLTGAMARHKSEDEIRTEKILREEQEKERHFESYDDAGGATKPECSGADDPEERCPKQPHECTCWEVELDYHPKHVRTALSGATAVPVDEVLRRQARQEQVRKPLKSHKE